MRIGAKKFSRVLGVVFSFLALSFPAAVFAADTGNIIGFVYDKDGTTPLEGAIVQFKNLSTDKLIASSRSDKFGIFKLEGIESGIYVYGVMTAKANFNSDGFIAVKVQPNETAKMAISLKPYDDHEAKAVNEMFKELEIAGESLVGTIAGFNASTLIASVQITKGRLSLNDRIHAKGQATNFYQDVKVLNKSGTPANKVLAGEMASLKLNQKAEQGDLVYVVKKKNFLPLLVAPAGFIAILATSSAIQSRTTLDEEIIPRSAYKK